jgi:hypothetical protein
MGVERTSLKRRHRFILGRRLDTRKNPLATYADLK